jgi:uncharacterized membrane protein
MNKREIEIKARKIAQAVTSSEHVRFITGLLVGFGIYLLLKAFGLI